MKTLLKNGTVISSAGATRKDVLIENKNIIEVSDNISTNVDLEIDCTDKFILPGMIDTHVHFRDPGFTHKGDAHTESIGAVAGGVTTICDMPNTNPQTLTIDLVKEKQELYANKCLCNFGIYIGASKNNLDELKKADEDTTIPAIKIFMAESTGEMTLAEDEYLRPIFKETKKLIATHAEDELRRLERLDKFKDGTLAEAVEIEDHDPYQHAIVRDNLCAALGTERVVNFALEFQHQSHVLHMSAAEELEHLKRGIEAGLVTGETCPHYLLFNREDIKTHGTFRVMNPALKGKKDQEAMWQALQDGVISQITTDHAPHLESEKELPYGQAPAGMPGVEFVLPLMLTTAAAGYLSYEQVVALTAENPAKNYKIQNKGHIKEGYDADIVIVDPQREIIIENDIVRSKCGWTPYAGIPLTGGVIEKTFVNGNLVFDNGKIVSDRFGTSIEVEV